MPPGGEAGTTGVVVLGVTVMSRGSSQVRFLLSKVTWWVPATLVTTCRGFLIVAGGSLPWPDSQPLVLSEMVKGEPVTFLPEGSLT